MNKKRFFLLLATVISTNIMFANDYPVETQSIQTKKNKVVQPNNSSPKKMKEMGQNWVP